VERVVIELEVCDFGVQKLGQSVDEGLENPGVGVRLRGVMDAGFGALRNEVLDCVRAEKRLVVVGADTVTRRRDVVPLNFMLRTVASVVLIPFLMLVRDEAGC
jgi:hypothetical protein